MEELRKKVQAVLDEAISPYLAAHGGSITLMDCGEKGVVTVELLGACAGCPSADLGTRQLIEDTLKARLPEITRVELFHQVSPELLDFARRLLSHEEN